LSVLVIGNAVLDIAYRVPRLPKPGETLLATARTVDLGGKGLNQAIAARRASAQVRLLAPVGRDPAAVRIREALTAEGIDPGLLVAGEAPTDESVIWVAEDGENAIVSIAEAAHGLRPTNVAAVSGLGPADTLLMQGNIPLVTTAYCLDIARRRGARLVVNTAPLVPGAELLVPMADVLVVNVGEAAGLSGARDPVAATEALVARGAASVVVTLGAAGVHLFANGAHHQVPTLRVKAVDTTGAGDVFTGVLVAALDAGADLPAAAAWAARAAALKVTRRGTVAGFPTAAELAALRHAALPDRGELPYQ
jgi:ribokinase